MMKIVPNLMHNNSPIFTIHLRIQILTQDLQTWDLLNNELKNLSSLPILQFQVKETIKNTILTFCFLTYKQLVLTQWKRDFKYNAFLQKHNHTHKINKMDLIFLKFYPKLFCLNLHQCSLSQSSITLPPHNTFHTNLVSQHIRFNNKPNMKNPTK